MTKPTILIIAGGENSRFAPLNTKTHKGFLSLGGKPIVVRALENLKKHGFYNIVLVLSQKDFDGNGFSGYLNEHNLDMNITTILQEKASGMGDAVLLAKKYLNDTFILASPYYSNLGQISEQLWQKHLETKARCVFSGTQTSNPELYGILEFDPNNNSEVVGIVEKIGTGTEPSVIKADSIYLFDTDFIQELEKTKKSEYSLETAITAYVKKAHGAWILNTGKLQSLKYTWHLFSLFSHIMEQEKTYISPHAELSNTAIFDDSAGPVIIDDFAKIGDFAKLVGPCYVGKNAMVGDYSFVRNSTIEAEAIVGANTEVVRSILFEKSSIHFGYLADSIIGHETKIGAGLITANKRLDRENIRVKVKDKLIDIGSNTLGVIVGEKVTIGIRVSTMPGITIAANANILPNQVVTRNSK